MALEDGGVNNRLPLLVDLRFLDELLIASRLAMYTGASPLIALNVSRRILKIIRSELNESGIAYSDRLIKIHQDRRS